MWKSWEKEQQQRVEILVEKERTAACNQNNYVCVLLASRLALTALTF